MSFYSNEEFHMQVQDLVFEGKSWAEADAIVREREIEDEREYNEWRNRQENDNWYENQYEVDTDYL